MIFVKQYGCKRSGTCYVTELLKRNFSDVKVIIHGLGGKHQLPVQYGTFKSPNKQLTMALRKQQVRVAIAIKNPYSWAWSYVKAHRRWKKSWRERFEADPVKTLAERCVAYNMKNKAWMDLSVAHRMIFRHEDLLAQFQGTMQCARDLLALDPRHVEFTNVEKKMTPNDSVGKNRFDPTYYFGQRYLVDLGPELIQTVTDSIDWETAARAGYIPIDDAERATNHAATSRLWEPLYDENRVA